MATLITTTGDSTYIIPENKKDFKLEELQHYVKGYIEVISLNRDEVLVLNEEGKFHLVNNMEATRLEKKHKASMNENDLGGDVVVCKRSEIK